MARGQLIQPLGPDEVADIGHSPVGAGLYELVIVKLVQILFQYCHLLCDDRDEGLEGLSLLLVADAVDGRQEIV